MLHTVTGAATDVMIGDTSLLRSSPTLSVIFSRFSAGVFVTLSTSFTRLKSGLFLLLLEHLLLCLFRHFLRLFFFLVPGFVTRSAL